MTKKTTEAAANSTAAGTPGTASQGQAAQVTVAGQRHVPPAGRHSKQTHARATARAQSLGLTTTRELYDYDRAQVLAKLQKGVDGKADQHRNEQNRRSGVATEKPETE